MLEMIVLGVTVVIGFALAQVLIFFGGLKFMTNKKFMKKWAKKYTKLCLEVAEEMEDMDL